MTEEAEFFSHKRGRREREFHADQDLRGHVGGPGLVQGAGGHVHLSEQFTVHLV